jgi:hypothetical protein
MYDAPDNLPLDCYVLSQWTDNAVSGLDPDARRKRLARDFVALGAMGRFVRLHLTNIRSFLPAATDGFHG